MEFLSDRAEPTSLSSSSLRWRVLAIVFWSALLAFPASAQFVTFVEFGNMSLLPDYGPASEGTPVLLLQTRYELSSAVLKSREWAQSGKRLDFALVLGIGINGWDHYTTNSMIREIWLAFQGLPTDRLAVMPAPEDLGGIPDLGLQRYEAFLTLMRKTLQNKTIYDLTKEPLQLPSLKVIGINSVVFHPRATTLEVSKELARIAALVTMETRPTILVSYQLELAKPLGGSTAWKISGDGRDAFSLLVTNSHVCAVIGAPLSTEDWSAFGVAHDWRLEQPNSAKGKKAWVTPTLHPLGTTQGGFQFVSVTDDGAVTANPFQIPKVQGVQPMLDLAYKIKEGDAYFRVRDYDKALEAYRQSLSSTNPVLAAYAREKFESALAKKEHEWSVGRWSRQFWYHSLEWTVMVVVAALILGALALFWKFRYALFCRRPFYSKWRVRITTEKGSRVSSGVFLEEFRNSVANLDDLFFFFDGRSLTVPGRNPHFFVYPLMIDEVLSPGTISVRGVDLGKAAGMLQRLFEHFSWTLEIRLAEVGDVVRAYASLRWGPRIFKTWCVECESRVPDPLRETGKRLAVMISAAPWVK